MNRPPHAGFTLVELLVTITVLGILVSLAVPSFRTFQDKYRLKSAAENLASDLQFARSEAVRMSYPVSVSFSTGSSWCYAIGTLTNNTATATCTCAAPYHASCLRVVRTTDSANEYPGISLAAASGMRFEPVQGRLLTSLGADASSALAATLESDLTGRQASAQVGLLGMGKVCTPSGAAAVDYPSC